MNMIIKEIKSNSCMTKSKLTNYVINLYIGCEHGRNYCHAVFMKKFNNIKENWGDFVYVKINCSYLILDELRKNKPGNIWFSSVTDPYLPLEAKYKLTRKILESIVNSPYKNKFTIEILTKSVLVKRDFDLLKQLKSELGFSVNALNKEASRILELFASSPELRIKTLKEAKENKIKVYDFISPVLPGITNLEELFKALSFCNYVWVELLNTKKFVLNRLMPVIRKNFPDKINDFNFAIKNHEEYYNNIKKQTEYLEDKYKLKVKDFIVH